MDLETLDRPTGTGPDAAVLRERLAKIVTERADSPFGVSGAVFGVADRNGMVAVVAAGRDATGRMLEEADMMPLASASKLAVGLMILKLVDEGALVLGSEIGRYLPQSAAAQTAGVTIARMLSHTSGLPLEIRHDLSDPPGDLRWQGALRWPGALAEACLSTQASHAPGSAVQYSNVAYGLLALAAEQVTGTCYPRLLDRLVFEPLGVNATVDRLPVRPCIQVTDVPSPYAGTALSPYNSELGLLFAAPWAGTATDTAGALKLVRGYRPEAGFLSPELARVATSDRSCGLAGGFRTTEAFIGHGPSRSVTWEPCPWGLAVEVQGGKQPHWAPPSLPGSFGQIGSSGCLAWHDPGSGASWAIFGARTTESGWLLRHGARIAQSAIQACRGDHAVQETF